ncbi:MAG TPA: putative toxin-antitoxin system toxin component, PIN family [Thermomicrobiales bacterium]|nr:putative toxin-antitoxin system toxin component, PIN family [Thermomicrobiales bacterium]
MRAYLDTNLYISYLIYPFGDAPPSAIVNAGISGRFTILFSDPTLREVLDKTLNKPSLRERLSHAEVDDLFDLLDETGEHLEEIREPFPALVRDRKDDYLVAHAVLAQADFLVSGDKDLLAIGEIEGVRIVSPADFVRILDNE